MPERIENTSDIGAVDGGRRIKPSLTIDYARYEKLLENSDLSDDQKKEFIDTLFSVIIAFVDLGYGVHPLQQAAPELCGQELDLSGFISSDVLSSTKSITRGEFENATAVGNTAERERDEL